MLAGIHDPATIYIFNTHKGENIMKNKTKALEEMEKRYADGWYNSIAKAGVYRVGNDFFYRGWKIYPEMPEGYFEDTNNGVPLRHTVFIINGSPLKGGKRALLYIQQSNTSEEAK